MKTKQILGFLLTIFVLMGCNASGAATPTLTMNASLPTPQISITHAPGPDPLIMVNAFLQAWKTDDYATMYGMLSQESQSVITADDFAKKYTDAMNNLTLKELAFNVSSLPKVTSDTAQVNFHVTYKTNMVGNLERDMTASLKLEGGQWRVTWDNGLILPELHDGSHLAMDIDVPARGSIYDRNGKAIVKQTDAKVIGLIPSQIDPETEGAMLKTIGDLVDLYPGTIQNLYSANPGANWYIPVGEVSLEDYKKRGGAQGFSGVQVYDYNTRFYTNQVAPQTIGYVSAIQKDELNQMMRLGFSRNQLIGRIGIEKWEQDVLAGKNGGSLHVVAPDGAIGASLGSFEKKPGSDIYLTLDEGLQFYAQKGLEGFRGAIVVIERNTGKVLAMASSPGYDPNFFDPANQWNGPDGVASVVNDPNTPSINRAAQSKYPLGSVFKVITFAAALGDGTGYTPEKPIIDCPYHFTIQDRVFDDWTWSHYLNEVAATGEGHTKPSGPLDLSDALKRSCNPWFWHIGQDLYEQGRKTAIADMARGFGLGAPTGIVGIDEAAGNITNPPDVIAAVNQAIGQGDVQVTPLQVARMMAAIGNGGTLLRPQLIEKIVDVNGVVTQVYKPDANSRPLPISNTTLKALQEAMHKVIYDSRGTAFGRFPIIANEIPLYGKTGTAESGNGKSHAWFAGYTDSLNPDFQNIAIAVIAENAGEGSQIAAPMFSRMAYVYLHGKPGYAYPWETDFGITRTPTIPVTPTQQTPQ